MSEQDNKKIVTVSGKDANGLRLTSKIFEEEVRGAAAAADELILESFGQHNIGLRLGTEEHPVTLHVTGPAGQRLGCMGLHGATIISEDSASDDVGYLNIGADIINLAFGIFLASVGFAFAIAVGLGSRETAGHEIDSLITTLRTPPADEE